MRSGRTQYTQAHKSLNDIGILTNHGSMGPDLAIVSLDRMYRPASSLVWQRERGWELSIALPGPTYDYRDIPIGPPDMTPGKAARAAARLLTEQAKRQRQATEEAVYTALGDGVKKRLGDENVSYLRRLIVKAMDTDVLAEQDGDDR